MTEEGQEGQEGQSSKAKRLLAEIAALKVTHAELTASVQALTAEQTQMDAALERLAGLRKRLSSAGAGAGPAAFDALGQPIAPGYRVMLVLPAMPLDSDDADEQRAFLPAGSGVVWIVERGTARVFWIDEEGARHVTDAANLHVLPDAGLGVFTAAEGRLA